MKQAAFLAGFGIIMAAIFISTAAADEGKVVKLDLKPEKDRATLVISHTGGAKFRLFQSEKQGSVIIEAENLSLPPALTKMIDASVGLSPVLQLTPYNSRHGDRAMAKLVIQLRGRADVTSTESPHQFTVEIVRKPGALGLTMPMQSPVNRVRGTFTEKDEIVARLAASQKSEEIARKLIEVLNTPQEEKKYFGSKVTFEAKDADVPDIFRLVGESSELNIIWDPDVEGAKTSLAVKDLPWDQLLDIVIQQKGYKAIVMGNVIRIMTVDTFNKQSKARKEEIFISDELEPVVMAVIPLSFAEAADIKAMIKELIEEKTGSATASGATSAASTSSTPGAQASGETKLTQDFKRGRLEIDKRTNSLIVTNTKDSIERIRRLVKELDVPVPQVLIDAKIVIASENFSRQVGIKWQEHLTSESGAAGQAGAFGEGAKEVLGGGAAARDSNSEFAIAGGPGSGAIAFGFGAGSRANITAQLQLAEINGISKTVASPRLIVNNNKEAKISDGTTISKLVAGDGAAAQSTVTADLKLTVTPQVTSRGSVQLKKFSIEKGAPISNDAGNTVVDKKALETEVMVDSGATLVLGGIYQMSQTDGEGGIPVLKDLPFIGQLFRTNSNVFNKSELMVFITPQIIDPEAGGQAL